MSINIIYAEEPPYIKEAIRLIQCLQQCIFDSYKMDGEEGIRPERYAMAILAVRDDEGVKELQKIISDYLSRRPFEILMTKD